MPETSSICARPSHRGGHSGTTRLISQSAGVDRRVAHGQVLIVLKRRIKKRAEDVPNLIPTIGQVTRWLADTGGYTGKSSGGPPGSTPIRRGLERVQNGADAVRALRE